MRRAYPISGGIVSRLLSPTRMPKKIYKNDKEIEGQIKRNKFGN